MIVVNLKIKTNTKRYRNEKLMNPDEKKISINIKIKRNKKL